MLWGALGLGGAASAGGHGHGQERCGNEHRPGGPIPSRSLMRGCHSASRLVSNQPPRGYLHRAPGKRWSRGRVCSTVKAAELIREVVGIDLVQRDLLVAKEAEVEAAHVPLRSIGQVHRAKPTAAKAVFDSPNFVGVVAHRRSDSEQ